jgi:hypothetical protein
MIYAVLIFILISCGFVIVYCAVTFRHYLFDDPIDGDGNFNPPVYYYEESDEDEDNADHKERYPVVQKKKHFD